MSEDRRGFLAAVARKAAHGARTIAKEAGNPAQAVSRYVADLDSATDAEPEPPAPPAPEVRLEARVPSRRASIDDLRALAADTSLAARTDALTALALRSTRLARVSADGADGWIVDTSDGEGEVLVGQVALSSVALAGTPLARPGWLRLYVGQPHPASERGDGRLPGRAMVADLAEDAPVDAARSRRARS